MFEDYFVPFVILLGICLYNHFQNWSAAKDKEMKELAEKLNERN